MTFCIVAAIVKDVPEANPRSDLARVLARNLAQRRKDCRDPLTGDALSQAGLAQQMALAGIPWTQSTVALIETHRRQVTAIELIVISMVLETPVASLLDPGDAETVLVGESTWSATFLRRVVAGDVENIGDEPSENTYSMPSVLAEKIRGGATAARTLGKIVKAERDAFDSRWGLDLAHMGAHVHRSIFYADSATEREAADRVARLARWEIAVEPRDVAAAGWRLWKCSYEDERERRVAAQAKRNASERTRQALRGHVVRQLDRELLLEMSQVLGVVEKNEKKRRKQP